MNIGESIKSIRLKLKLTQEQVCARARLTQGFYSSLENGFVNPSIDALERIAEVFKLPVFLIIWDATDPKELKQNLRTWYNKENPCMQRMIEELTSTQK